MPNAIRRKSEEFRAKQGEWGSHLPEVGIIGKAACQYLCGPSHKYCFFVIGHDQRKILHFNVTRNSVWSKISNALKRLGFRSPNFLSQLDSETSRARTIVQSGFEDQV